MTKANDSRLNIFDAPITGPLGHFGAGGVELMAGTRRRTGKRDHELMFLPKFHPHVTALKIQPGMHPDIINAVAKTGIDVGLVLETFGSGALPNAFVPKIASHVKKGYPVFVSSSCTQSGISADMQLHDEDAIAAHRAGVRNVGDMTTTAAVVKLMHVMDSSANAGLDVVTDEMTGKNYAGELTLNRVEDF